MKLKQKIDFFNKNKIRYLEGEIETLWYQLNMRDKKINDLEKTLNSYKDYQYSREKDVDMLLRGIIDYLEVDITRTMVDDPSYDRPMPRQMEIIKLIKNKK